MEPNTVQMVPQITVGGTLEFDIAFEDGAVQEYAYTNPDTGVSEIRTNTILQLVRRKWAI